MRLIVLMAFISIGLTDASEAAIRRNADRPRRVIGLLGRALDQGLAETEAHLQSRYLTGGDVRQPRRGRAPLAVRSGLLRNSTDSRRTGPLSGIVGIQRGPASAYAGVQLGKGKKTITPKRSKHLWIPIADNLTGSGQTRMTPREAMSKKGPRGGRRLSIFVSKRGNLVAVLRTGGTFKRGARKGQAKGKLLFRLAKSVTVEGTDGLAQSVIDKSPRLQQLVALAMREGLEGGGV